MVEKRKDNEKDKEFKRIERFQYAYCIIIAIATICTLIFGILIIVYGNKQPTLTDSELFAYGLKHYGWLLIPDALLVISLLIHR